MPVLHGHYDTAHGSKYLQQLCKHFAHKIPVDYSETEGRAELPLGLASLTASDTGLAVKIDLADSADVPKAKHVIDKHLERFAFREGFTAMTWATVVD